jgi:hypothetical protein
LPVLDSRIKNIEDKRGHDTAEKNAPRKRLVPKGGTFL